MKISYFKYIIPLMLAVVFSSCSDELEQLPFDAIATDIALETPADFENALKGMYVGMRSDGYYGASSGAPSIYFIPDVISDDVIINNNGRRSRETFYDWRYDEDDSSETFWLAAYRVVQRANFILENIDKLSGDTRNAIEGEALAARAVAHYDLVKLYADSPANTNGGTLGVPYIVSTDAAQKPTRNTLDDTYANIMDDLNSAASLMDGLVQGVGRIDANVVRAYMTRINLFMGNDSGVISSANSVTGSVASMANFSNVWKDASNEGVLFKLVVTEPDNVNIGVAWLQESPDGIRSEYNVDKALYDLYQDNDVRKDVYFETSAFAGVDYNHIVKYRGRLTGNANEVDAKVLRYEEVLLSKAEAQYNSGDQSGALSSLDELRAERYTGFTSPGETGQALADAIALERRLELAFEGVRFFDLKRKGLAITRSTFGDQADGTGFPAEFFTLTAGDHRFNMAIGQAEMAANTNMEQNPGY